MAGRPVGFKHSEETKRKIRESNIGLKRSAATCKKLSELTKGKPGRKQTAAAKEKLSKYHLGLKSSIETRQKISDALKGRKLPKDVVMKMIKYRTGKKLSDETKAKISFTHKLIGTNIGHTPWNKGKGKSSQEKRHRDSKEYKQWRVKVFQRDNYTCQHCAAHSGNGKRLQLNADHIKPFCLFPALRFEVSNGRTLCLECHLKTDTFSKSKKELIILFKDELSATG